MNYLMLGKNGDLCNILPILQAEYAVTRQKPVLLVSREFKPLIERIPNINPVWWDGDWQDLRGAYAFAKRRLNRVKCLSTFGNGFPIQKKTPSFAIDQWERAGAADQWDTLPLRVKSAPTIKSAKNSILFADLSESAPFLQKNDLADYIHQLFPDINLVRLSELRLRSPADFVSAYDEARALVSVDTMHLSLSKASNIPVIALVRDNPSYWHGMAWQKRFRLHVRYEAYEWRKEEIGMALKRSLNGDQTPEPKIVPTSHAYGYNPSLFEWCNERLFLYRYHPEKKWKTKIAIQDAHTTGDIVPHSSMKNCSLEDAKLFEHDGKLWLSCVVADIRAGLAVCTIGYGELAREGNQWRIGSWFQPRYPGNDWSKMEKNWCFFSSNKKLFAIYQCTNDQIVFQIDNSALVETHKTPALRWSYGHPRGGTMLRWGDKWLRLFHSNMDNGKRHSRVYYIGAAILGGKPPFKMEAISRFPILAGNERYTHGCFHWKGNVCFPGTAVARNGEIELAVGLNDCECGIMRLTESNLNL